MNEHLDRSVIEEEKLNFLDYLIVLAKHSRVIVFTTAGVAILTMIILLCIPNKYTARARLVPPQQNLTLSGQLLDQLGGSAVPSAVANAGLGGMAANLLGLKTPGDLYVGMLTGNTIFDRIIKRFNLREARKSWYSWGEPYIEDVRKELSENVEITAGRDDGIISVEVTDEDPKTAADMANAFLAALNDLLQEMTTQEAKERLAFLEKERSQTIANLNKAEEELRNFSERSSVLQIDAQTKGMLEYIATLRASIDVKEVQLRVMRQQATPFNYDVIRLETELKGLKEKLQAAEAQEAINPRAGDVMIPISKVPQLSLEYIRLFREAKYQDKLYELYCKLVELARLDTVRTALVLQVVDRGTLPEKKSKPKRLLITVLISGFTFFLMIIVSFWSEHRKQHMEQASNQRKLAEIKECLMSWRQLSGRLWGRLRK